MNLSVKLKVERTPARKEETNRPTICKNTNSGGCDKELAIRGGNG